MNAQFKKGALELCVLSIIKEKDMYGYELVQNISNSIMVNEGTIYPILRRLTKEGYLETYMVESTGGPARKYYKLTSTGNDYFIGMKEEWIKFTKVIDEILSN